MNHIHLLKKYGIMFMICFDYALACDTYQKYNCKDIPSLDNSSIPAEISDIHYDCDLSKVTPLGVPSEIFPNSKLIKSL